jgi:RNA polymerase sigma factor (sigma-70 family)
MDLSNATDEVLMRRVQNNDLVAFEVLYGRHAKRVEQFFKKRSSRAEDLFQECFMRLLERRDQWQGAPFLPWLLVMARHLLIDDYRREKVRHTLPLLEDDIAVESLVIDEWLEGLSASEAQLVKEHYLAGLSYSELALRYKTEAATLRQKISRALRRLQKEEA